MTTPTVDLRVVLVGPDQYVTTDLQWRFEKASDGRWDVWDHEGLLCTHHGYANLSLAVDGTLGVQQ